MAYVPGYTGDVFVSYAHLDNGDGWVTEVKSKLAARLKADLAGEPEVWFDADRLRTGDVFKPEIYEKINNTLMLVAVISPAFLNSQFWMEEELNLFLDQLGREVIQLVKVPLAFGQAPPLPDAIYEELFDNDSGSPLRGSALDLRLDKIIWTIRRKMEETRQGCTKIYLAQPRKDTLRSAFLDLRHALHGSALAVLPSEIVTQRTMESKIQKWIEEAALSIHVRSSPPDPLAEWQRRVAERAGTPMIVFEGTPQKAELPAIVDQVRKMAASMRRQGEVYFIYDYSDQELAGRLRSEIALRSGRKLTLPQPGETYHKAKLSESDGVVLLRSLAPQTWFDAQKQTLRQASALRAGRDVPEAYYLVQPGMPEHVSQNQQPLGRWEIERVGLADVNDLQPFFQALSPSATDASEHP